MAEAFYVVGGSVAPRPPDGSRCLVSKLAADFVPGDVIVYIPPDQPRARFLVVVQAIDLVTNGLIVQCNQVARYLVKRKQPPGRIPRRLRRVVGCATGQVRRCGWRRDGQA